MSLATPSPRATRVRTGRGRAAVLLALLGFASGDTVRAGDDEVVEVEPVLVLVTAEGTAPVAVAAVLPPQSMRYDLPRDLARERLDLRSGKATFPARPGATVFLETDDARSPFARIAVVVPTPVPKVLRVRIPARDHPKLTTVTLEVVDETTRAPLPSAALEWDEADAPLPTQRADPKGRIEVGPNGDLPGYLRLERRTPYLHASGYRGWESPHRTFTRNGERLRIADAEDFARQLEGRPRRIALRTREKGYEERAVRILDVGDQPVEGAFVWIGFAICTNVASASPRSDWSDGLRRTGKDGIVTFSMQEAASVEIRVRHPSLLVGGVPIAAWALLRDLCPKGAPRDLRLPPTTEIELSLDGIPAGQSVEVAADPFGRALTPSDGPLAPLTIDAGISELLAKHADCKPAWAACAVGPVWTLRAGGPAFRSVIPVGRPTTLWFGRDPEAPYERTLEITPTSAEPVKLTRRWDELKPVM